MDVSKIEKGFWYSINWSNLIPKDYTNRSIISAENSAMTTKTPYLTPKTTEHGEFNDSIHLTIRSDVSHNISPRPTTMLSPSIDETKEESPVQVLEMTEMEE